MDARFTYKAEGRYVNDNFDASRLNAEFQKNKEQRVAKVRAPVRATAIKRHAANGIVANGRTRRAPSMRGSRASVAMGSPTD